MWLLFRHLNATEKMNALDKDYDDNVTLKRPNVGGGEGRERGGGVGMIYQILGINNSCHEERYNIKVFPPRL